MAWRHRGGLHSFAQQSRRTRQRRCRDRASRSLRRLEFGALKVRAGGAYAWHTIDTSRIVALPGFSDTPTGHYNGGTGQIFGEAGYGIALGKVAIEPFAGAAWVHLATDAFNERGGAAALRAAANSFEVGYSTLGVRAASLIPLWWDIVLVLRVSAAWQHAFSDVTPTATLAFQGAGAPFVIAGVPAARDSVLSEAGLDLVISRNATLGISLCRSAYPQRPGPRGEG